LAGALKGTLERQFPALVLTIPLPGFAMVRPVNEGISIVIWRRLATIFALSAPAVALAAPLVALDAAVFVERIKPGAGRLLEPASRLKRGDRLVYVVSWQRMGGGGGFTVTNPLPRTVSFQRSAASDELVSVDGGKRWGKLEGLRIGARSATPEDVTHLRWRIAPTEAAKGTGRITYSAIVR
jgi:hypothetical protein